MSRLLKFVWVMLISGRLGAQSAPVDALISKLELLASGSDLNLDKEDILKKLDVFARHPLNLNIADEEDLKGLAILSDRQIRNFLNYRKIFGQLVSKHELQAIPGWDLQTIRLLLPFIQTSAASGVGLSWKSLLKEGHHNLLLKTGFNPGGNPADDRSQHLGASYRLFMRYRFVLGHQLQWQFLGDKDAGEQFLKGSNKQGFDFNSFHLLWKPAGMLKFLLVGDFTVNMGQGLTQWQGLALSKSTDITSVKRESPVIRPYTSSGEANFCRGIAGGLHHSNWTADFFISRRKIGANLDLDSINDRGHLTALNTSGYHRTVPEIAKKNNIRLFTAGASVGYQNAGTELTFNMVLNHFEKPIQKRPAPYNIFEASGQRFVNSSVEFSHGFKKFHFFCEAAVDGHFHSSLLGGAMLALSSALDLSIVARNMSRKYQSVYASSFSENQLPANERGVYAGITMRGPPGTIIQLYVDHYRFPWLKYRVSAPSTGNETVMLIKYQPSKLTELTGRLRYEQKSGDQKGHSPIAEVIPHSKKSLQLQLNATITKQFSLRTRLENVWFKKENGLPSEGFLFFSELLVTPKTSKWNANIRLQYFDTDDYDSRIYAYENVMSNSFGFPAYSDNGLRTYLNFHYDLSGWFSDYNKKQKLEAWMRLATTMYVNTQENTEAKNHSTKEVQFQISYSF